MSDIVKIERYEGKGIPVHGNEIDTDRIIPARFMKCVTFAGLGKYAFYDERFQENGDSKGHVFDDATFAKNTILIVNKNFGCGSSREHAPQALKDFGIKAIIGESFAEIFAGNCTALGIPAVQLSESDINEIQNMVQSNPGSGIVIDLLNNTVEINNWQFSMNMPDAYRNSFLDGTWNSTALLLSGKEDIEKVYGSIPYLHFQTTTT